MSHNLMISIADDDADGPIKTAAGIAPQREFIDAAGGTVVELRLIFICPGD